MSADITTREGLFAVMRKHAAEREAAKPIVAELLQREELPWDEPIPEEWKTAGFVEELTRQADAMMESSPPRCLLLLQLALAVPTLHPQSDFVATRCDVFVWRCIGLVHRALNSLEQSVRSFTRGIRLAEQLPALTHDQQSLTFGIATVFAHSRKFDEATRLLSKCEDTFAEFGDKERHARCTIVRASIASRQGDFASAYTHSTSVLETVLSLGDAYTQGILFAHIAQALLAMGRIDEGRMNVERALNIFIEAGMPSEIDRVRWMIATSRISQGDFVQSIGDLGELRAAFIEREMLEEAGLIALDMADALLALGDRATARTLIEQALGEFEHAGLPSEVATAMAYLRDVAGLPRARTAIKHVRSFIERATTKPEELFVPPPCDE